MLHVGMFNIGAIIDFMTIIGALNAPKRAR